MLDLYLLYVILATQRDIQATLDRQDRERMDVEGELAMVRARKLEELRSEGSFLAGLGATGDPAAPTLRPMIAVVSPEDFVFLAADYDEDVRVEYGRLPRAELVGVEVLDAERRPIPDSVLRPLDPMADPVGTYVVALDRVGPEDDDHRLGFVVRSAVVAGELRDRFLRYVLPAPQP